MSRFRRSVTPGCSTLSVDTACCCCLLQLEVHKPLVNLVDNMVTMGSLYGGDNIMLASQYKKVR